MADAAASRTWHHGLVARWWAQFGTASDVELSYYRSAIHRFGQPALDLACGTGRLLIPLASAGYDVDGVDVSDDMLEHARRRADRLGLSVALIRQAMHELDPPRTYRTVYVCDSFGIGGSRADDRETLRRVHRALEPGGALVLSHDLPQSSGWMYWLPERRAELPASWPRRGDRRRLDDGTDLELRTRIEALDPAEQTLTMAVQAMHWAGDHLLASEERQLEIALYFRVELAEMLTAAGFDDVTVEGYYTGRPAAADDTSVVFVARR